MVNWAFPSNGLLRTPRHNGGSGASPQNILGATEPAPQAPAATQVLVGAPPSSGGPWVLCRDPQGRLVWFNRTTSQWAFPGSNVVQPPPQTLVQVQQVPQQQAPQQQAPQQQAPQQQNITWVVPSQAASAPPPQQLVMVPVNVTPTFTT